MLPRAVSDQYRAQQRLIVATLGLTRGEWFKMGPDFDASWANIAPRVELITASAQLGAARNGAGYVPRVLAELGESIAPLGDVDPRAFAGIASDGRPLGSLLEGAKMHAKRMNSLEAGGKWLDMAVHTQIADASRGAAAVSIAAHPGVGYVRMVNPPCCGPCAVLAGREYRFSQGFQRHPRCDCMHIPSTLANPGDHYGIDPHIDQITDLTAAERKALLEGSDLSRVINARRGGGRGKLTTTELAKRGQTRLTPDGIFVRAGGDRDEALRLLRQNGYLTDAPRVVRSVRLAEVPKAAATRPALDTSGIRAAKTPQAVADELQRLMGARGTVSGFEHPSISLAKAAQVAEQVASLAAKYPRVRFDVVVGEIKDKKVLAQAQWRPEYQGKSESFTMLISRPKMTARSKADDMLQRSRDAGHWSVREGTETDAMTYVVTHEFGHLIDYTTGNYSRAKAMGRSGSDSVVSALVEAHNLATARGMTRPDPYFLWRSPKADPVKVREFHEYNAFIDSQVSGYAKTSSAEGIAEAFADVEINGDRASESNKSTVAKLIRLLEEMG